jgi:hypothetical protein
MLGYSTRGGKGKHVLLAGIISGQVQRYNLRSGPSILHSQILLLSFSLDRGYRQGSKDERDGQSPEHPSCCAILYLELKRIHD